jgi:hypothetical protein
LVAQLQKSTQTLDSAVQLFKALKQKRLYVEIFSIVFFFLEIKPTDNFIDFKQSLLSTVIYKALEVEQLN